MDTSVDPVIQMHPGLSGPSSEAVITLQTRTDGFNYTRRQGEDRQKALKDLMTWVLAVRGSRATSSIVLQISLTFNTQDHHPLTLLSLLQSHHFIHLLGHCFVDTNILILLILKRKTKNTLNFFFFGGGGMWV
jgi:hypothetical protein